MTKTQSADSHTRWFPPYHFVLFPMILLGLIGSVVNLYQSLGSHERLYSASLIVLIMVSLAMLTLFARVFGLRAQDRAIRAEENLRHFVLTGTLLDPRLTIHQIIGLRFASDEEIVALSRRAADEGLSQQEIKKAIATWRADWHRV